MMTNNKLIRRFFKNQCTEEEALAVAKYLENHPEILDELLPKELWDQIEEPSLMPPAKKEELLKLIQVQTQIRRRLPALIWRLSIAASIIIILSVGLWMAVGINGHKVNEVKILNNEQTTYTLVKINYGREDMLLRISDGSVIYLKPGGEIRYLEQLSKEKRDFSLKGVARFKVAADKKRPFHVYAGGTVTTALGTDFTISSEANEESVSVLLHSGKVVVGPDSNSNAKGMKKTYLLPGNKLVINKVNFSLSLIKNADQQVLDNEIKTPKGKTELTATTISFRNQSLYKIFSVLQTDFSASIQFDKTQVKGMYFTGSFKRNAQTVAHILTEIALLNHLNIERRDTVYLLTPQSKK